MTLLQVMLPDYQLFLDYMCPGHSLAAATPPQGSDPAHCPRLVLGVYDDHDYGWNNGNKRWGKGEGRAVGTA